MVVNTLSLCSSHWSHVHRLFHKMHHRLQSVDSWIWSIQCVFCSPSPLLRQKQIRTNPIRHQSSHLLTIWSVAHTTCPLPLWHTDSSPLRPAVEGCARCNSYKQCTWIQEWGKRAFSEHGQRLYFVYLYSVLGCQHCWNRFFQELGSFFSFGLLIFDPKILCKEEECSYITWFFFLLLLILFCQVGHLENTYQFLRVC